MAENTAQNPRVSVVMITYNHERFIAQAIESAVNQQTDFPYEIVIGEDCSTDGTARIVRDYQARYPTLIRALLRTRNLGAHQNFMDTLRNARGEYIALLEGDDYWTDPRKLQKQVEFLDRHPECSTCFHPALVKCEDVQYPQPTIGSDAKDFSTLEDILEVNFVPTLSIMFRARLVATFPDWYHEMPMGDWPLLILLAQHGKLGCIREVMGTYRAHSGGIWSSRRLTQRMLDDVRLYAAVNLHLAGAYEPIIRQGVWRRCCQLADTSVREWSAHRSLSAIFAALRETIKALDRAPARTFLPPRWKACLVGRTYACLTFVAYELRDLPTVRHCLPRAIAYDLSLLSNRGVWSIGMEAFLGSRVSNRLRHITRRVRVACHARGIVSPR